MSAIFLGFALCLVLYVPVLLITLLLSLLKPLRRLPMVWTFITCYLFYECAGVLRLTWVWLRYRHDPDWIRKNRLVQIWWARSLLRMGAFVFRLDFAASGTEALPGNSALMFVRHASLGDTVIPLVFFSYPRNNEGIRYVIKKELLISPSLDIGGHRLSTVFVDRSGLDTEHALATVGNMTATAPEDESLLIFPEGTRNTRSKRQQLRNKSPHLAEQLERWPDLLPPRMGGVGAMLENNPGKDVVFAAHTGFEGYANLTELLSGTWQKSTVRIHLWRVPYADIPADYKSFLFEQWDNMQAVINDLRQQESNT
ncbi:MAG: 1-acyl-sn-glycerol-3-phosphate acyltransferase [Pseudomonadota bacterium]